jgi:hypothetical protein
MTSENGRLLIPILIIFTMMGGGWVLPLAWAADNGTFLQNKSFSFDLATNLKLPKPLSDLTVSLDPATGLAYLAGGCDSTNGNVYSNYLKNFVCTSTSNKLYAFDRAAGSFTTLTDMPVKRYRHAAALANKHLWLFGGRDAELDALLPTLDVS